MATLKNDRGTALLAVLLVSVLLLSMSGSGLLFTGLSLKATGNHKTGTAALHVADAGISHAIMLIPSGTNFNLLLQGNVSGFTCASPCNGTTNKPTLTGSMNGYSYTVVAANDASDGGGATNDTNNIATLTSTAQGADGSKKVVVVYVSRAGYGLGATNLIGSQAAFTETNFAGSTFSINGNDNCNAAPAVPGIAVSDAELKSEITNSTTSDGGLASTQMASVTGSGGSPSVSTVQPLSQTVSALANDYLTLSHVDLPADNYSGNSDWGTSSSPQITRIMGNAQITGTITGYGVLVVDGSLDIAGNFTFHGLVIARGNVGVQVTGSAGIYGSLIIAESTSADTAYELDVRGNANIRYDSCALSSTEGWIPIPKAAKIKAWTERL